MKRKKFGERGMELSVRIFIKENIEMGMYRRDIVKKLEKMVYDNYHLIKEEIENEKDK